MTLPSGTSSNSLFYFIQTILTSSWSNKPPSTSTAVTPYQHQNYNPYSSIMELLFTQFGKLLLPTQVTQDKTNNMNPITSQTTYERQKKPEILSCYTPTFIDALTHSFDVTQSMQFKTCHQAILCVRMLLAIDTKLKVFVTDEYLSMLQHIETMHWKTDSFGSKHVIVIEGLSGSGKTEILEKILTQSSQVNTIRSWETHPQYISLYKYIMTLSKPIQICFAFLDLYRIVYEIMTSTTQDIFVLEEYYHHFLVKYLLEHTYPGFQEDSILSDVFAWPLDLPMPELVLYLTTSTTIRLERTQSKKPFASILPKNHQNHEVNNDDDDDNVGIIQEDDHLDELNTPSSTTTTTTSVPTTWPSSDEQDLLANVSSDIFFYYS